MNVNRTIIELLEWGGVAIFCHPFFPNEIPARYVSISNLDALHEIKVKIEILKKEKVSSDINGVTRVDPVIQSLSR